MSEENARPVIIRRVKKHAHGHHGGAWKVAYADFVTAMMAFFLLMWLMGSTTRDERAAISKYFTDPSMVEGNSPAKTTHPTAVQGPGGASTSLIEIGGSASPEFRKTRTNISEHGNSDERSIDPDSAAALARAQEQQRLEQLKQSLDNAINASPELAQFRDQLLIDITQEGLRIQIVDKENRPMFDLGSVELKSYTTDLLHEIAKLINTVPNHISISGHTDARRYTGRPDYSNWELSADRANAARRALLDGGMDPAKIARVVGLASSVGLVKNDPLAASNRRISILVMKREQGKPQAPAAGNPQNQPPDNRRNLSRK
jgi:chemotaxis protein MotB